MSSKLKKVKEIAKYVSYAQTAYAWGKRGYDWYQDRITWSLSIGSEDELFPHVVEWMGEQAPKTQQYTALSFRDYSVSRTKRSLGFIPESSKPFKTTIGGYEYEVSLQTGSDKGKKSSLLDSIDADSDLEVVLPQGGYVFIAKSEKAIESLKMEIRELHAKKFKLTSKPMLFTSGGFGNWTPRNDLPIRPMESVILADGQLEKITNDLQLFLDSEDEYVKRGVPYHRGYMLHGPPGTGKSSAVRAITGHLNLDLFFLSLGDIKEDSAVMDMISHIERKGVLLLEDIDRVESHTSLSALLNALDGVATPHGLVTMMTTNNIEKLDPVLLRKGRIDMTEFIGLPDLDQVARLWETFYPNVELGLDAIPTELSTSWYYDVFKVNMGDPDAARKEIENLL